MINLRYDLTPLKYLSIIVCEIGAIPPHSIPVVITEIMNEQDNEDDEIFDDDESSSSEDDESKNIEDTLGWNLVVGGNDDLAQREQKQSVKDSVTSAKHKRMAQMAKQMEMEMVNEDDEEDN